jgi:hypothetical protein
MTFNRVFTAYESLSHQSPPRNPQFAARMHFNEKLTEFAGLERSH